MIDEQNLPRPAEELLTDEELPEELPGGERTITCPCDGRRLDVLLSEAAELSRSRVAALMEEGRVLLDGKPVQKAGTKGKPGQEASLTIPAPRRAAP